MNNLVSIIIPVYNASDYIENCILSIQSQTYKKIEIVAVDDGSTDDSKEKILQLCKKYHNIKLISQKNGGVSSARNTGIKNSKGDFICFMDSDDLLKENFIEILLTKAIETDSDIIRANYFFKGRKIKNFKFEKIYNYSEQKSWKNLKKEYIGTYFYHNVWGQLLNKRVIKSVNFDTNLKMGEDFLFNLKILENAKKVVVIPDYLYIYTYNENGMNYNDSFDKISVKIKNLCTIYDYINKSYNDKFILSSFIKEITPHVIKSYEYTNDIIIENLLSESIFEKAVCDLRLKDLNKTKFLLPYIFIIKKKWILLKLYYLFVFKPIKKIKNEVKRL